ncbi:MAG: hypothetical protein R3C51_13310 [Parvularculaceae bacterium]
MMKKIAMAALAAVTLAACASSTPYGPASANNPYGFSEQRIEQNRYRIVFRGNSSTTREAVETYLLYRAAELTLQSGFDHFVVTEQDTEANTRYSSSPNAAFFGRYSYGYGPYCCAFPYYAYGWGWGSPYDSYDTREITRYTAIAFVTMHAGPKPADNPQAFDARDVVDNLRSYVVVPAS